MRAARTSDGRDGERQILWARRTARIDPLATAELQRARGARCRERMALVRQPMREAFVHGARCLQVFRPDQHRADIGEHLAGGGPDLGHALRQFAIEPWVRDRKEPRACAGGAPPESGDCGNRRRAQTRIKERKLATLRSSWGGTLARSLVAVQRQYRNGRDTRERVASAGTMVHRDDDTCARRRRRRAGRSD